MPMKHIEIEREETRKESWSEEVGREKECYDVTRVHSNTKAGERKKHALSLTHTHTHMLLPVSLTQLHFTLLQLRM